ncbi:MAG: Zn-ribbon domain-containing OB-fold protein [Bryobacteraceae bacterium]
MSVTVYTETVIYAAPEQFAAEAPYQLAIVTLENGKRLTARVSGDRVKIGDAVEFSEDRNGVPFYRRTS